MKRLLSVLTAAMLIVLLLTGCGEKRRLYSNVDLANYVKVGDYLGLQIDTSTDDYKKSYAQFIYSEIDAYKISSDEIKSAATFDESADATVELGDIVNIDFKGYKGETEINNGSAQNYLLVVGSGSFIDTFEQQLVNAKVGQTVNVSVTFPSNYTADASLAGVKARFDVKINSIAKAPEQLYKLFSVESEQEYADYLRESTLKNIIFNTVCKDSKIENYPKKDVKKIYNGAVAVYAEKGADLSSQDEETVLQKIVYPLMNTNMVMYYILDAEGLEIYESTVESQNVSNPVIAESYAVQDIVLEYLLDNAVVK